MAIIELFWNVVANVIAGLLPKFVNDFWNHFIIQKWLRKPPKNVVQEAQYFLEMMFYEKAPIINIKSTTYLSDSKAFFLEKVDILDSLERDLDGEVEIICRVPWLVMPRIYRNTLLDSIEARTYYNMLERQVHNGKLRYLYNFNSLSPKYIKDSIRKGFDLNCLPMLLQSTNFDIMLAHTTRHNFKILFAK